MVAPEVGLLALGREVVLDGERREIVRRAGTDDRPIVRLAGFSDRTAAESLRGKPLLIPRDEAPPLEEDEWYAEELEGCAVHDGEQRVGVVRRLLGLPSCDVLEVARDRGGDALLVPLVRDAVRTVDLDERRIEIDLTFLGEAPSDADPGAEAR